MDRINASVADSPKKEKTNGKDKTPEESSDGDCAEDVTAEKNAIRRTVVSKVTRTKMEVR